jgi:hypothetical protein
MPFREETHADAIGEGEMGAERACGHDRHRGSCPDCQRAQLDRWRSQLESVETVDSR